jgi:hypothetical protein
MRLTQTFFGLVICASVGVMPALAAQHGHQGAPPAAHPTTTHTTPTHATTTTTTGKTTAGTTTAGTTTKASPHHTPVTVPQRIAANPALAARLQPLVPSGMTLAQAAAGFKNQGQFIAALHVSRNLNIPFAKLKAEMTGADHDSLGQAIHDLRPTTNTKTATKTAEHEADQDVKVTTTKPVKPHIDADDK